MSKIKWDQIGERMFETGVDHGVLYPMVENAYPKGVAFNGLTAMNENPSGAEANPIFADNIKYINLVSAEDYGATMECLYTPPEFDACDGLAEIAPGVVIGQQNRQMFGFAYRSLIGNDTKGQNFGYKLHLIYGAQAAPSSKNRQTVNDNPDATTLSYEISTTPVEVPGYKPTAHLTIDSTRTAADKMAALEDILFGSDDADARLPLPEEIISLITDSSTGEEPDPENP